MMDELDEERSSGQVIAAASAAAGLLGALALALTRKRDQPESADAAYGVAAKPSTGGPDFAQVVDQVAEVAPELVAALDRHAPEVSRQIRSKLPLVRAFGGASLADAVEYGKRPSRVRRAEMGLRASAAKVEDRIVDVAHEAMELAEETVERTKAQAEVDFSALSAAQAAAAQAAIAAVAKAENAFGASERFAGLAGKGAADTIQPLIRDVAQQAATLALDLWQNARSRGEAAADDALHAASRHAATDATHAASAALGIARGAVGDVSSDVLREALAARERAERAQQDAESALRDLRAAASREAAKVEHEVKTAKEKKGGLFGMKFMWLASLLGLGFYIFIDEERRRETSTQVREVLRDLRGYDDEF